MKTIGNYRTMMGTGDMTHGSCFTLGVNKVHALAREPMKGRPENNFNSCLWQVK